ncbi:MAG: rhomboid family intramembrane serine protease [Actinobacteria bacterium]|nr:rhomboid family intramembrane serine protease [Actinomycetota bacterium]
MAETLTCYRHPDRETGVSCSECGRGLCPDCMRFAAVGIRCPEHSGEAQGAARVVQRVQSSTTRNVGWVAKGLVAVNVGIYLLQLAQGAPTSGNGGSIFENGVLFGPLVAEGEWWRLITAAFLHYGFIHLGMNMLALWLFGPALENVLGPARFLMLYLVGGLAGSAGALLLTPNAATVGASGAIYGLFGAILVLERQGTYVFGGSVIPLLVINFAFTLFIPGISKGGHIGGFIGGVLAILVLSRFGKQRVAHARNDLLGYAGLVAIGVVSVAIAYGKVRGYA